MASGFDDETSPVDVETEVKGSRQTGRAVLAKAGGAEDFTIGPAIAGGAETC